MKETLKFYAVVVGRSRNPRYIAYSDFNDHCKNLLACFDTRESAKKFAEKMVTESPLLNGCVFVIRFTNP